MAGPEIMTDAFSFQLLKTDGNARLGEITTPHGAVATPAFLPIGTQATVKGLAPEAVRATGADIVLANTYHLMLRPGAERIAALGGLHRFMNWPWAILTDSGGFQVMSLSQLRKVEDKGVTFRSHLDGAMVELSPERAIEVQHLLGSDIAMQLDECLQLPASPGELRRAMQLSLAWAERSKRAFERSEHHLRRLADRKPADRIALKVHIDERGEALLAQLGLVAALHDPEQRAAGQSTLEGALAALGPAQR